MSSNNTPNLQSTPYQVYSKPALSSSPTNITRVTKVGGKKNKQYGGGYTVQANNTPTTFKSNSVNNTTTTSNNSQQTYSQGVANATNDGPGLNAYANTTPVAVSSTTTSGGGRRKSRKSRRSRNSKKSRKSRKHKRRNTYKK